MEAPTSSASQTPRRGKGFGAAGGAGATSAARGRWLPMSGALLTGGLPGGQQAPMMMMGRRAVGGADVCYNCWVPR
jgi:hypothetical protein